MDFRRYLDQTANQLDREVERILNQESRKALKIDKKLSPLLQAFTACCMGGKRIRGTLIKLGYELSGKKSKQIVKVAAAYEIFHSAILAHDDIMDQSEMRRNKPALYKRVGVGEAITLADLGFFLAMKIIAHPIFFGIALDTTVGQLLDLKKADSLTVAKFKTARYTVAGPLQLGAAMGGANDQLLGLLGEFGENLGMAFQIKDDILDREIPAADETVALAYVFKAKKLIPQLTKDNKMSTLLEQMADYLVQRTA